MAEVETLIRAEENEWDRAAVLHVLGRAALGIGDLQRARELLEEAEQVARKFDDPTRLIYVISARAETESRAGEQQAARRCYEALLALGRRLGFRLFSAIALQGIAHLALVACDPRQAGTLLHESLSLARDMLNPGAVADACEGVGTVAIRLDRVAEGVALCAAADAIWRQLGDDRTAFLFGALPREALASARATLDEASFTAAWEAGQRLTPEQALSAAAALAPELASSPTPPPGKHSRGDNDLLTPRETDVLRLMAGGKSNSQIAAALVLSVRTVERHLSTIYSKLGAHGGAARATAVRYAITHNLLDA